MGRARWRSGTALILASTALLAASADARKFQMTGTWAMRRGGVFVPLQFAMELMGGRKTHTSAGNLSKGFFFPNGPVPGLGGVTATGSAPATLVVPRHRFGGTFSTLLPLRGVTFVQLTTMFDADGPAAPATLAPGGGPGSFTWCVGDPGCVDLPGTQDPPGLYGIGRVIYRSGSNQFGGVMQMLLRGGGTTSAVFQFSPPFQAGHVYGGVTSVRDAGIQHTGGPYANAVLDYFPRGFATQPLVPPTLSGLITAPGPKVTTMFGVTYGPGLPNPTLFFPAVATTPMGMKAGEVRSHTGFPFTTGTVFAQQTVGSSGDDFFTLMGSDMRTALGAGNIALVAGGITRRRDVTGVTSSASFGVVRMTLSPPVPSLSPAGLAAAALLVVLGVGYALRRCG